MSLATYQERVDDATEMLDWIRERVDDEEREHLALELLDATRGEAGSYDSVLLSWFLTIVVREHPDYQAQVKEWHNLDSAGELFLGTPMEGMATIAAS